jgi:hypothetical protein
MDFTVSSSLRKTKEAATGYTNATAIIMYIDKYTLFVLNLSGKSKKILFASINLYLCLKKLIVINTTDPNVRKLGMAYTESFI